MTSRPYFDVEIPLPEIPVGERLKKTARGALGGGLDGRHGDVFVPEGFGVEDVGGGVIELGNGLRKRVRVVGVIPC